MLTIAADPKYLGAKIAISSVLHLGIGDDPSPACAHDRAGRRSGSAGSPPNPNFFLPVLVLS
jgi:hypothetical protein